MERSQLRWAILLVMGVLLLGACNSFKLFHSSDDKAITTSIQSKLFSDPILKTRDIRVDSRNGVVTLSGTVATDLESTAVERIATQQEGVKNVVNMLSVTSQSATPASGGVQTAEGAASTQVTPPAPPPEQPAPAKPWRAHQARSVRDEDKASAELQAYTNSITPDATAGPAPTPVPAPAPPPTPPLKWPQRLPFRRLLLPRRHPLPSRRSISRFPRVPL